MKRVTHMDIIRQKHMIDVVSSNIKIIDNNFDSASNHYLDLLSSIKLLFKLEANRRLQNKVKHELALIKMPFIHGVN